MPNFNGRGPQGGGPMTGRGLGPCGGGAAWGYSHGCGRGRGMGRGFGTGASFGPRLGWFPAGYGPAEAALRTEGLREALERRASYLKAELAMTEEMLKTSEAGAGDEGTK